MQEFEEESPVFNVSYSDLGWDFLQQGPLVDPAKLGDIGHVPHQLNPPIDNPNPQQVPTHVLMQPYNVDMPTYLAKAEVGAVHIENEGKGSNKRRRAEVATCEKELRWQLYSRYPLLPVFNANHVNITPLLSLKCAVGKNTTYSPEDECWIHYKNNHFKLDILMECGEFFPPMWMFDAQRMLSVDNMCTDIYVIRTLRELGPPTDEEDLVPIYEADSTRSKNNLKVPDTNPISPGIKVSHTRLRFEAATANTERRKSKKGPTLEQEYYRIVVRLKANISSLNTSLTILAYVSDPLIVRGQNPSRYGKSKADPTTTLTTPNPPPYATQWDQQDASDSSDATLSPTQPYLSPNQPYFSPTQPLQSPTQSLQSPTQPQFAHPANAVSPNVSQTNSTAFYGKVGINTSEPHEALTVAGNVFVTGTIVQPSDIRVKKNVTKADTAEMLANVNKVQLVDYEWKDEWKAKAGLTRGGERGVIAQQVQQVLPSAISAMGNVKISDYEVPNMLAVNEKTLLIENIGATQELTNIVTKFDKRITALEYFRRRARFLVPLVVLLLLAALAVILYFAVFRKQKPPSGPFGFPYPGRWTGTNSLDGGTYTINFYYLVLEGFHVNVSSQDQWFTGPITNIDNTTNPPQFELTVNDASITQYSQYLFIFQLDECPQFMHLAYNPSKEGYPSSFSTAKLGSMVLQPLAPKDSNGLPLLHIINKHVFCAQYSCGGNMSLSALFMSDFAAKNGMPDLLYDGNCKLGVLNSTQSCADFSVMSDVGQIALTKLNAHQSSRLDTLFTYNSYYSTQALQLYHTYYILAAKEYIRSMFVFTITQLDPTNHFLYIDWAVLSYMVMDNVDFGPFSCNSTSVFYNASV